MKFRLFFLSVSLAFSLDEFAQAANPPSSCTDCAKWNKPQTPFRIHGNTYYVGVHGLSSVLIKTAKGLVLLDADLPQSAALIENNIRALGFSVKDIQFILNSHAHFDHAGGIAKLQRDSGAVVVASAPGAKALEQGGLLEDDPQFGFGSTRTSFPPVAKVRVIQDQEVLAVGEMAITAHLTPGHTPGSTTWTWPSCENGRCVNIVYADSLNAVSAPGFRFLGDAKQADIGDSFRHSITTVAELPCDVLLTVHPDFSNTLKKFALREKGSGPDPFIDAQACRAYADEAQRRLEARLQLERAQ